VFAAIDDVPRQAADGQVHASGKDQDDSKEGEQQAPKNQYFAKIGHFLESNALPPSREESVISSQESATTPAVTNLLLLTCVLLTGWMRGKLSLWWRISWSFWAW